MANFFTSLFSSKSANPEEEKAKNEHKNFDVLKYDGLRAQKIGKLGYAIKCFTEALNIKEDFETMSYLVAAYSAAGKTEDALDLLNRMLALEPDHAQTRLARVNLLFMMDKDADAINDCEYLIGLDENDVIARLQLGKAKRATGDTFGALADLTRAIALKEDYTEAYLLRAEVLLMMGQKDDALADVEKAIELMPEEENAYLLRGKVHAAMQAMDDALADYQSALDLNPFNESAILAIADVLITLKREDEAIHFLSDAIETQPAFAQAYAERGRAKNQKGDKDGAFEDMKKAIELNPEGDMARKLEGSHSNFDNLYQGGIF